jgi:hypothetical protein
LPWIIVHFSQNKTAKSPDHFHLSFTISHFSFLNSREELDYHCLPVFQLKISRLTKVQSTKFKVLFFLALSVLLGGLAVSVGVTSVPAERN